MAAAAAAAVDAKAQAVAQVHSPPLPPPHDLSECPSFSAETVARAVQVLSRDIGNGVALRIARAVAADATAAERADTQVLDAQMAVAHAAAAAVAAAPEASNRQRTVVPWPWTAEGL